MKQLNVPLYKVKAELLINLQQIPYNNAESALLIILCKKIEIVLCFAYTIMQALYTVQNTECY